MAQGLGALEFLSMPGDGGLLVHLWNLWHTLRYRSARAAQRVLHSLASMDSMMTEVKAKLVQVPERYLVSMIH